MHTHVRVSFGAELGADPLRADARSVRHRERRRIGGRWWLGSTAGVVTLSADFWKDLPEWTTSNPANRLTFYSEAA
jgi:hypothetical protein